MKHANEKTLHKLVIGTTGEGKELKTVKIWCEKEFGIKVPDKLINDKQLYTHKEVWQLLDRIDIESDTSNTSQ